jgi:predicted nucleic acid-binding protein
MNVFVDTSAFYAVLDRDDLNHSAARAAWAALLREKATLFTTSYVLVETMALLQRRIGIAAMRAFHEDILPLLQVDWIAEEGHRAGVEAVLAAGKKALSMVDCVSFQAMRQMGLHHAFCFDKHFSEQGFATKLSSFGSSAD